MIRFESPWWFAVLALLVPALVWAHTKSYADLDRARARWSLALRILALALIVTALSRPLISSKNTDRAVIFAIDVSDSSSAEALETAWNAALSASKDRASGESTGLMLFGRRPRLVRGLSREPLALDETTKLRLFHLREKRAAEAKIAELERSELGDTAKSELAALRARLKDIEAWRAEIGADETDVESALRLARGALPADARRRVCLWTDGEQNRGDALRETAPLAAAGVSVETYPLVSPTKPEVVAESLRAPAEAQIKAPFDVELTLRSNFVGKAMVRVFRNKYLVADKTLDLVVGENLVQVPKISLEEGLHEFEAVVSAVGDTSLENNVARAAVRVAGRPKVLLVERDPPAARYLEEALAADEIKVEVRPETGMPVELNDLLDYDVVILSDVPSSAMTMAQMENVKRYVKEFGGGFVMLGGEHSFGLGGYYRTPIEDALPVKMPMRKNVEKPNLALMLVIDKSGSMSSEGKMELAKESAIAAAEVLKPTDKFGVIAFDSVAEWICRLTEASEIDAIRSQIARLVAGGGTNIYPALYDAYQELLGADAKLKHIILLTDGVTEGGAYDDLVAHIAADEMTLSTVGIGSDADQAFLKRIAEAAGGECYIATDFSALPQILTRETLRASKSMLVEEPFVPVVATASDVLRGIDTQSMPMLLGYVATQPKDTAVVALVSEYKDPVLATWTYGLGRAAAFTSDAKPRWAGDWIGWEHFSKFWAQLVRSVMSTGSHKELQTRSRVSIEDGQATVMLDVRDRRGEFRDDVVPEVSLVESAASTKDLSVTHVAPGLFEAKFPVERFGEFYRLLVVQKQKGQVVDLRALAATESYSPEFKRSGVDEPLLRMIARETGGAFQPDAKSIFEFEGEPARTPHETWWWWLVVACLLLPIDIALRRLWV